MQIALRAQRLFPNNKAIQQLYSRLLTADGAIEEAANLLGMQAEYNNYIVAFKTALNAGKSKEAAALLGNFRELCKQQLIQKYG